MASLRMHQGSRIVLGSSSQPVSLESDGNALHVQRGCRKLMTVAADDYTCQSTDPCSAAADPCSAAADPN